MTDDNTGTDIRGDRVSGDMIGGDKFRGDKVLGDKIVNQYFDKKGERGCPTPPAAPTHFGGRDVPLADLTEKLKRGEMTAITAVQGLGGIGKTTLAQKLAHDLHADGTFSVVLWTNVTRQPDPTQLLTTWASHAEPDFAPGTAPLEQVAVQTRDLLTKLVAEDCPGRALVVLDDVWDNGLNTARLLRAACPTNSTVLVTTRSHEVAVDLDADISELERLTPDEGVALLREYLSQSVDEALLKELVDVLGGHALALKLAARRINKKKLRHERELRDSIAEYKQGLPEGTLFRDMKLENRPDKEDNLTISLWLSYLELDDDAKKRFRALGVLAFDAPVSALTLAAVWGFELDEQEKWQAAVKTATDHADELCLLALLEPHPTTAADYAGDWYALHPLLRALARTLLDHASKPADREAETTFKRYAEHMTVIASAFRTLPPERWDVLTPMLPHVNAVGDALAEQYARAGDDPTRELSERAANFAYNITRYLEKRQEVHRVAWLEMGLAAAHKQDNLRRKSLFSSNLGFYWQRVGENQKALDYHEQALEFDQAGGDQLNEATTLNNIGGVWSALGEPRKALDYFERSLPLSQAVEDRAGEATTLNNIGMVWHALGEGRKALDYYERALPLFDEVGDRAGEARTLNNIGLVWHALGEGRKALDYYEQALPLRRAVGDRAGEATTLNNMAAIYISEGELARAEASYRQLIDTFQELGAVAFEAVILGNLALLLHSYMGRTAEAIPLVERALALLKQYDLPQDAAGRKLAWYEQLLAAMRDGAPPAFSGLPAEQVEQFTQNTIVIATDPNHEQRDAWRSQLQEFIGMAQQNGHRNEQAFFTALLAAVDGRAELLPESNPYAGAVARVVAALGSG